jgi:hypothetical protein
MTPVDPTNAATSADHQNSTQDQQSAAFETVSASQTKSTDVAIGMTSSQAEQIISQLKSLKQNLFILTLIGGFFALRAIVFHR